jgi:carbamoyl-phosphate synthase small subunit
MNLNDKTCEGFHHKALPAFSVQYHPEASPGPHDSRYLFQRFIDMMKKYKISEAMPTTAEKTSTLKPQRR